MKKKTLLIGAAIVGGVLLLYYLWKRSAASASSSSTDVVYPGFAQGYDTQSPYGGGAVSAPTGIVNAPPAASVSNDPGSNVSASPAPSVAPAPTAPVNVGIITSRPDMPLEPITAAPGYGATGGGIYTGQLCFRGGTWTQCQPGNPYNDYNAPAGSLTPSKPSSSQPATPLGGPVPGAGPGGIPTAGTYTDFYGTPFTYDPAHYGG
jgi:hypothetical protein